MPRRDARADYRHFPPAYSDLLRTFKRTSHASLGPMTLAEAKASTRDLYRFKMFLLTALDDDPTDDYARELSTIFADITVKVENHSELSNEHYFITLTLNPIVAAMRRLASQPKPEEPHSV